MTHTEVIGQPGEKDPSQAPFAQIPGKAGTRDVIVLIKGGVGIDIAAKPLAQNQLCVIQKQVGVKCRPHAALHAMVGPEHLLAMTRRYSFKRRASRMIGSKRVVIAWVPVLGQDHMAEGSGDAMNHWHNILATRYRHGAPITEVI